MDFHINMAPLKTIEEQMYSLETGRNQMCESERLANIDEHISEPSRAH